MTEKNKKEKEKVPIEGMTCASCAQTIEGALDKQEGIEKADVNLMTEKASIEFDPKKIDMDKISETVEKTGYKVAEKEEEKGETTLEVTGMTCASCADTVDKALSGVEGVENVTVNISTEKAKVVYEPNLVSKTDLIKTIEEVGYGVASEDEKETDAEMRLAKTKQLMIYAWIGTGLLLAYEFLFLQFIDLPDQTAMIISGIIATPVALII